MNRFSSTIVAVATAALFSGGLVAIAAPAEANAPCMSRPEYRKIKVGMKRAKVTQIVGSAGRESMSSDYLVVRQWKTCENTYGVATIGFVSGRVQSKSFFA